MNRIIGREDCSDVKLRDSGINISKYDMFYLDLYMKNGVIKTLRLFADKNSIPTLDPKHIQEMNQTYGEDVYTRCISDRILGSHGLMQGAQDADWIYIGRAIRTDKTFELSCYTVDQNGKTGQENFNIELGDLKRQVVAQELHSHKSLNVTPKGKTYVVGDIHGMYGSYMQVMNRLTPEDKLIIIGDVIDRGSGGIKILQDIIARKKDRQGNPDITFLLGNHERQFLQSLLILNGNNQGKTKLTRQDIEYFLKYANAKGALGAHNLGSNNLTPKQVTDYQYIIKVLKPQFDELLSSDEQDTLSIWLKGNGGSKTIFSFLDINDQSAKQEIYDFLVHSYVVLSQSINGHQYLFVHAAPPDAQQMIDYMSNSMKGLTFVEIDAPTCKFMVEDRTGTTYTKAKSSGFTTICGHTYSGDGKIKVDTTNGFIRIDCGCGHSARGLCLALYCVDNGNVSYIDQMEEFTPKPHVNIDFV